MVSKGHLRHFSWDPLVGDPRENALVRMAACGKIYSKKKNPFKKGFFLGNFYLNKEYFDMDMNILNDINVCAKYLFGRLMWMSNGYMDGKQ
jgi:hypothetical protein